MAFGFNNATHDEYGNIQANPITDAVREIRDAIEEEVDLTDSRLRKITRLRLVSDPGFPFFDLSYCYGELKDGTPVRVELPRWQFKKRNLRGELIEMFAARRASTARASASSTRT